MRRAEIVAAGVLAALSIYFMVKSAELPIGYAPGEGPGGGFWPFWLSAVMLICTLWIARNWLRRSSPPSDSTEPYIERAQLWPLAKVAGSVIAFVALVHFIGMYGAMFVFLLYTVRWLGGHRWLTSLVIAAAAPVVMFFFFDVAMRIVLPKGYLEPLFLPLYDIFL